MCLGSDEALWARVAKVGFQPRADERGGGGVERDEQVNKNQEENKEGSEKKPRSVKAALVEEGLRSGVEGGRRGRGRGGGKKEKVDEEKRNSGISGKIGLLGGGGLASKEGRDKEAHTRLVQRPWAQASLTEGRKAGLPLILRVGRTNW